MTRILAVFALAIALAMQPTASASAAPIGPERFGSPVYLALGDSVAAGVGAQPRVTGYPEQLDASLEKGYNPAADKATPGASVAFDLVNLAVPGATASSLATQLEAAERLIADRADDRDPFNDVEVITVTIGGNDVFGPAVQACVLDTTPTDCQAVVDAALRVVQVELAELLRRLVAAAGKHTEVVVTTYYNPIGSCVLSQLNPAAATIADVVLEGGSRPGVLVLEGGLNDVIRSAAAATGAQVAELYDALDASQYVGGRDCLHPNLSGHAEIADIIGGTISR